MEEKAGIWTMTTNAAVVRNRPARWQPRGSGRRKGARGKGARVGAMADECGDGGMTTGMEGEEGRRLKFA